MLQAEALHLVPLHTFVISCYFIVWFSLLSAMFNTPICLIFHDVLESAAYVLCHVFHGFKGIVRVSMNVPHVLVSADVFVLGCSLIRKRYFPRSQR